MPWCGNLCAEKKREFDDCVSIAKCISWLNAFNAIGLWRYLCVLLSWFPCIRSQDLGLLLTLHIKLQSYGLYNFRSERKLFLKLCFFNYYFNCIMISFCIVSSVLVERSSMLGKRARLPRSFQKEYDEQLRFSFPSFSTPPFLAFPLHTSSSILLLQAIFFVLPFNLIHLQLDYLHFFTKT